VAHWTVSDFTSSCRGEQNSRHLENGICHELEEAYQCSKQSYTLGVVVHTYNSSSLGGWGRRTDWAQGLEATQWDPIPRTDTIRSYNSSVNSGTPDAIPVFWISLSPSTCWFITHWFSSYFLGWDVAWWYSACLACVRPLVRSQHQKRQKKKPSPQVTFWWLFH
jgi:hypothetical protein